MSAIRVQLRVPMLAHRTLLSLLWLLILMSSVHQARALGVGPNEPCEGPAIVWPPEDLYGSIYISATLHEGAFPRVGYLPSGTIVTLNEPSGDVRAGFLKNYCSFNFRNVVVGNIDRRHITKVGKLISAANLTETEAVVISPANPESGLELFHSRDVTSKPFATLKRSDRTIILLSTRDISDGSDALRVRYTADISSRAPRFTEAYIKTEDDRLSNFAGTYRMFRAVPPERLVMVPANVAASWLDNLKMYLSSFIKSRTQLSSIIDQLKQYAGVGDCGRSEKVELQLELSAGADIKIVGMDVKGSSSIEWEKPEEKATQFASFRANTPLALTISGTAQCKGKYPAYLEQADVIVGDPNLNNGQFVVDRDELFSRFSEESDLKELKDEASLIGIRRDKSVGLTQMVVVPQKPEQSRFYYTYFNQLERFMYDDVFQTPLSIDDDDRYALTLLVGEAITYWRPPNIPSSRGYRRQ